MPVRRGLTGYQPLYQFDGIDDPSALDTFTSGGEVGFGCVGVNPADMETLRRDSGPIDDGDAAAVDLVPLRHFIGKDGVPLRGSMSCLP